MKRILDCHASDFKEMGREELLHAIAAGEGRAIACETIGCIMPMLGDITNAEFAASMGADILLLNMFDVKKPYIAALPKTEPCNVVHKLKELTGRPIGINLEPVEQSTIEEQAGSMWAMTEGRIATLENAKAAAEVTMMVRLRLVSRYCGICCVKKFMLFLALYYLKAKSTDFLAEIRTFWHFFGLKLSLLLNSIPITSRGNA